MTFIGCAGLQLGQSMLRAGWDYRIFERAAGPGSFYAQYPVHRKLISLNKRYTGRTDPDFNLRHDWNSLLDADDTVVPMPNRTDERWPHADTLRQYLVDFAHEQERGGRVAYNSTVVKITRLAPDVVAGRSGQTRRFTLQLQHAVDGSAAEPAKIDTDVACGVVVMAMGLGEPNVPMSQVDGIEHTEQYADLPPTGESFKGLAVAVLGAGNAAFETADVLSRHTSYVHMWKGRSTSPTQAGFTSWESRYVGGVRAINAALFDSYLLKSLDGLATHALTADNAVIRPCGYRNGTAHKLCMWPKAAPARSGTGGPDEPTVQLGDYSPRDRDSAAFVTRLGNRRVRPSESTVPADKGQMLVGRSGELHPTDIDPQARPVTRGGVAHDIESVVVRVDDLTPGTVDEYAAFSRAAGTPFPLRYDRIISCLGWKQGFQSLFDPGEAPRVQPGGKFAVLSAEYESTVPGLYVAGAAAHGKDYRRSAGGFIHGFRYTARSLHKILAVKYEGVPWPDRTVIHDVANWDGSVGLDRHGCNRGDFDAWSGDGPDELPSCMTDAPRSPFTRLLRKLFDRINVASGPYQMIGVLGDGVVFRCPSPAEAAHGIAADPNGLVAEYMEDTPRDYFAATYAGLPRLFWSFGYGKQRQTLDESREVGTLFQVHLWFYPGDCAGTSAANTSTGVSDKEVFRLMETLHTSWNSFPLRYWTGRWLHSHIRGLRAGHVGDLSDSDRALSDSAARTDRGQRGSKVELDDSTAEAHHESLPANDSHAVAVMDYKYAPEELRGWASGGHVDVVVTNTRDFAVVVWRSRYATGDAFEQVALLEAGIGGRWESHEHERWQVDSFGGELIATWAVDLAHGIVQDFVL